MRPDLDFPITGVNFFCYLHHSELSFYHLQTMSMNLPLAFFVVVVVLVEKKSTLTANSIENQLCAEESSRE